MLKTITARFLTVESKLGSHIFLNVPVAVEESVDPKTFDPDKDDYYLSPEVIVKTGRILAKKWLRDYWRTDEDGNLIRRYQLTANEIHGIMLVCGIRATDLASMVQISPAQVSKVLNEVDGQTLKPLAVRFLLNILKGELAEPGFAAKVLEHNELNVRQSESDFDLRKA
jgi:hypothetical protein